MFRHAFKKFSELSSAQTLVIGYLFYALLGWLFLAMPICHNGSLLIIDNFFTAISAVSTAGLTTLNIREMYSFWGHLIILFLIQIGGIGYMTMISFVLLATSRKLSKETERLTTATFSLPEGISLRDFLIQVIIFTIIFEFLGAIALSGFFMHQGIYQPIWNGIFHSISAFCNAGFCLLENGFIPFRYNLWLNAIIAILTISGSLGFIVWFNFYKILSKEIKKLLFITKVILAITFSFILIGGAVYFFVENMSHHSLYERIITAFFQVTSATTTAGFNTIDIGLIQESTFILFLFLMLFGSSPSGTGGGLKSTTFSALTGLVLSTIRGRNTVSFWNREILPKRLQIATATFAYYFCVLTFALFFLSLTENQRFSFLLFEASSALSTAGLSMGITAHLTVFGKGIICLLMLMGRVGILSFGIAISRPQAACIIYKKDEELVF